MAHLNWDDSGRCDGLVSVAASPAGGKYEIRSHEAEFLVDYVGRRYPMKPKFYNRFVGRAGSLQEAKALAESWNSSNHQ
jgi:hypothetical protein